MQLWEHFEIMEGEHQLKVATGRFLPCFHVKPDLYHKSHLVAGGHLANLPKDSVDLGVASLQSLRLIALFAELNGL